MAHPSDTLDLREALAGLTVGAVQRHANLALFPILGGEPGDPWYRTLDEAVAAGSLRIEEVGHGGIVGRLRAVNRGKEPVFLLDGEELVGVKQNRIVNTSCLVPEGAVVELPVSCVEQGRWSYRRPTAAGSGEALFARARAAKQRRVSDAVRAAGEWRADQGEIWEEIEAKARRMRVRSATRAAADIAEAHRPSLEAYTAAFAPVAGQCGACFAIDGRLAGLDLFGHQETLAALLPKLVRSYALDALETAGGEVEPPPAAKVEAFLAALGADPPTWHPAPGLGRGLRLAERAASGGGLVARGELVHLCAFPLEGGDGGAGGRPGPQGIPVVRASVRRRRWKGSD